jgi:O-acetylhomoserine (thiol)-lyase
MSGPRLPGFDTLALHAGSARDVDHAANPTNAALEERMAALEGGVAGIALASPQAALHLAVATLAGAGEHIVASNTLPGGTHRLLAQTLRRFGIETTFVDPRDIDAWRGAIRPSTRLLCGATLGSPHLDVLDIPSLSTLAHDHHLPLMVDATFTTPWLQRPFDLGADLLLHSSAEFLGGNSGATGGLLVDGGTFDWQAAHEQSGRFPTLCEPCAGFDGMVFSDESTVGAFALRARREGLPDFGAAMDPHQAGAILQGLETLGLRMAQRLANTRRVVDFLMAHPAVAAVAYPELDSHPDYALAKRILPRGCGALVSFALKGDPGAGVRFAQGLQLFSPPTASAQGTLCLAVGLEDADDLIDELKRALKLAQKGA